MIHEGQYELRLQNGMGDQVSDRIAVRLAVLGMTATEAVEKANSSLDSRGLLAKTSRSSGRGIEEAARVLGVEPVALFGVTGGHPEASGLDDSDGDAGAIQGEGGRRRRWVPQQNTHRQQST